MSLLLEDGTGVEGADTFVTATEFRAYAAKRGKTYAQTDAELEVFLVHAMDFIKTHERAFAGEKVATLPFPRRYIEGVLEDEVPQDLRDAQCIAAMESATGTVLIQNTASPRVIKRKVDVIETTFADQSVSVSLPAFAALVSRYFKSMGSVIVERA